MCANWLRRATEGLVVMNGGDETQLEFDPSGAASKATDGCASTCLYVDGWDED